MSLNDILKIEKERVLRERVVLNTVYERLKNRINNSVKVKAKECTYTIPEFIPGYPLVDVPKTMEYLLKKLQKEGFIAAQIDYYNLLVTWDLEKIRKLHELSKLNKVNDSNNDNYKDNYKEWSSSENNQNAKSRVNRQLLEKEIERVNTNFIDSLLISKKFNNFGKD